MKNLMILLLSMFMIVILSSFLNIFGNSVSEKRKLAFKITREIGRDLKGKYGLEFMGISEAAVDKKYKTIGLELSYSSGLLSKDQGRRLLLSCAEDVLKAFNSYPKFRKHMVDVPFTGDNIIVNIFVEPKRNPDLYYPDIAVFSFYNDTLYYKTKSRENRYEYYTKERESLDEARRIVMAQSHRK